MKNTKSYLAVCALMAGVLMAAHAQAATISTIFNSDNSNSIGGANYFDLNVLNTSGITVTGIDVNAGNTSLGSITGGNISVNIYTRSGSVFGHESNSSGWTLVSSGSGTAAARNSQSFIDVSDFMLSSGLTGIAIQNVGYSSEYTNGNGSNQIYSNADLSLTMGSATNALFSGSVDKPRVWNGDIVYGAAAAVPEPTTLALLGLGLLGFAASRRKSTK